ncbi:hypothetical protein [Labedaea rhizosphaerae]|uniref:Uncharacterized protein n=1 Tax=Labedaea rhizosphaerae TaxID=598644 RepID=A0A4R6S828_LABRH|nr:hypothetical protein [Labedaea rhizosphaerae]TDP94985.1 hypothetical protein EV186_105217 [Labedaea rhizosphaerae]
MPEYGSHERAALFVLALENRAIPNPELVHDYGIDLRPPLRDRLNEASLLDTTKDGRRFVHQITDKGIVWVQDELAEVETPPRSGPLARVMFGILRKVVAHLRSLDIELIDILRPADEAAPADQAAPAGLESMIRGAYRELATRPQDWVRLAKLRPKLDGAERSEVDDTLFSMTKTGLVHLAPSANRRALTDDDHKAAIRINGEENHLLAIEES